MGLIQVNESADYRALRGKPFAVRYVALESEITLFSLGFYRQLKDQDRASTVFSTGLENPAENMLIYINSLT